MGKCTKDLPMSGLRADSARYAWCVPASHVVYRWRTGVAHLPPKEAGLLQWLRPCAEWQAARPGPPMAQAAHRPGLGPSCLRCSDGRENLQGKYGRKIVLNVRGRKRVHLFIHEYKESRFRGELIE